MKKINFLTVITITIFFLFFYSTNNAIGVEVCTFAMLFFNFAFSFQDIRRRFIFFAFQITFLVFLLGQNFASLLATSDGVFTKSIEEEFSVSTQLHIYKLLFVSLIGVLIGYAINEQKKTDYKSVKIDTSSLYITKMRLYSKRFMYFFCIFAITVVLEKAVFVQATGYVDYYTTFKSVLPGFFYKFESLYEASLYLFLATFPQWKECRLPLFIYFSIGLISLGFGQRNGFVLNILFIGIYFSIRHLYKVYGNTEVWINKKRLIFIIIAIPFLLFFLYNFGSTRVDAEAKMHDNAINNTLAFFEQQGGSVRIIGYEKDFNDRNFFPKDVPPYTFGHLINLYQQNAFFKAFNVYPSYEPQSVELAMKGHSFGDTITYLYDHRYYFAGLGLGSCYIAEVHHDFGIIGVFLINLIYGFLFTLIHKSAVKSVWKQFLCFLILMNLLYAPRSAALIFINSLLSPSLILFITLVALLLRKYNKRSNSAQLNICYDE